MKMKKISFKKVVKKRKSYSAKYISGHLKKLTRKSGIKMKHIAR